MNNIDVNAKKIGRILAQLRSEQNLTQSEFGTKINISPTHISTVENGGACSLNTLLAICDGLNVSLSYVVNGHLRNNSRDNFLDLLDSCDEEDFDILFSVAETLVRRKRNEFVIV